MQRILTTISLVYKDGLLKVGRKVKGKNKHAISLTFKINEYTCYFRNVNELLIQKKILFEAKQYCFVKTVGTHIYLSSSFKHL